MRILVSVLSKHQYTKVDMEKGCPGIKLSQDGHILTHNSSLPTPSFGLRPHPNFIPFKLTEMRFTALLFVALSAVTSSFALSKTGGDGKHLLGLLFLGPRHS